MEKTVIRNGKKTGERFFAKHHVTKMTIPYTLKLIEE